MSFQTLLAQIPISMRTMSNLEPLLSTDLWALYPYHSLIVLTRQPGARGKTFLVSVSATHSKT